MYVTSKISMTPKKLCHQWSCHQKFSFTLTASGSWLIIIRIKFFNTIVCNYRKWLNLIGRRKRPPNLSSALCDLNLLHASCCDTLGIYCNACLPGLVKIVLEISHQKGFSCDLLCLMWAWPLTSWPPKVDCLCICPVDHLWQTGSKLIHSLFYSQVW